MKKYYNIIITAIAIIALVFGCNQYQQKESLEAQNTNVVDFLNDTVSYYEDELGNVVATTKALAGDVKQRDILLSKMVDSTKELKALVEKYKTVNSAGIINTVTKIDTVKIPIEVPNGVEFFSTFDFNNEHYKIKGTVSEKGMNINEFEMYNKMSFVIGLKKNGFLKPRTYNIDVKNSNPYIQTIGIDSYTLTEEPKRFGVGPYIGYDFFIGQVSVGLSLSYNLIRF